MHCKDFIPSSRSAVPKLVKETFPRCPEMPLGSRSKLPRASRSVSGSVTLSGWPGRAVCWASQAFGSPLRPVPTLSPLFLLRNPLGRSIYLVFYRNFRISLSSYTAEIPVFLYLIYALHQIDLRRRKASTLQCRIFSSAKGLVSPFIQASAIKFYS